MVQIIKNLVNILSDIEIATPRRNRIFFNQIWQKSLTFVNFCYYCYCLTSFLSFALL